MENLPQQKSKAGPVMLLIGIAIVIVCSVWMYTSGKNGGDGWLSFMVILPLMGIGIILGVIGSVISLRGPAGAISKSAIWMKRLLLAIPVIAVLSYIVFIWFLNN